jgi:DNA mismatch repair protein MutH
LAGLDQSNAKAPNGLTFELKSVSFRYVNGNLVPKETMAITMINPEELRAHSFFESHCWMKLKTIVFCAVMWYGHNSPSAELLRVTLLDFAETDDLILEIKRDYDLIGGSWSITASPRSPDETENGYKPVPRAQGTDRPVERFMPGLNW